MRDGDVHAWVGWGGRWGSGWLFSHLIDELKGLLTRVRYVRGTAGKGGRLSILNGVYHFLFYTPQRILDPHGRPRGRARRIFELFIIIRDVRDITCGTEAV